MTFNVKKAENGLLWTYFLAHKPFMLGTSNCGCLYTFECSLRWHKVFSRQWLWSDLRVTLIVMLIENSLKKAFAHYSFSMYVRNFQMCVHICVYSSFNWHQFHMGFWWPWGHLDLVCTNREAIKTHRIHSLFKLYLGTSNVGCLHTCNRTLSREKCSHWSVSLKWPWSGLSRNIC